MSQFTVKTNPTTTSTTRQIPASERRTPEAQATQSVEASTAPAHHPKSKPLHLSPEFDAVYQDYSRPIYYLALRMLSDPTQAEDATHDVFLKAFRKLDQFKGHSNIRTWLYRITINHCQNLLRSWHHRNIHGTDSSLLDQTGTQTHNPLRVLEIKELGERIQKTLDALSDEYRLLLLLVADEKLSYEEVGALTDQTSDAVRGKLHRARKAFTLHFKQSA